MCSYGHQDFYRIQGRDPIKNPMTVLEREIFTRLLLEVFEAKVAPAAAAALMGSPGAADLD